MGDRLHGMARRAEGSGLNRGVRFGAPIPRSPPCDKGDNGAHRGGGPMVRIHLPPAASPVRTRVFEANLIDGQRMISPWSKPIANFDLRWTTYDIVNIGQCRRGDCSMSSVRDWTTGFAVIGTILLGPIIAFLTVVAAEVLIDFLKERAVIAAIAVCAVVAGMIGWVLLWLLFRRMSPYRVFLWVFFRRLTNTSD